MLTPSSAPAPAPVPLLPARDDARAVDVVAWYAREGLRLKSDFRGGLIAVPVRKAVRHDC